MGRNVFSAKGEATSPESGVGFLNGSNPTNYSMSAYKFHLSDPIVRSSGTPSTLRQFWALLLSSSLRVSAFSPGVVEFV